MRFIEASLSLINTLLCYSFQFQFKTEKFFRACQTLCPDGKTVLHGDLHAKMVDLNESMNHPFRSAKCKEERIDGECREGLGAALPAKIPQWRCLGSVRIMSENCDYVKSYSEKG